MSLYLFMFCMECAYKHLHHSDAVWYEGTFSRWNVLMCVVLGGVAQHDTHHPGAEKCRIFNIHMKCILLSVFRGGLLAV
jgi:hypothetical protein